jgi:peptidoglycan glycosyltransferase
LPLPQSSSFVRNSEGGNCGGGATADLATGLRLSCNITFAQVGAALGERVIRETAEKFGFGQSVEVPMSSEPSVYPRAMDEPTLMLSSFGQASVRTSPLQMAMVSMGIANGGTVMNPTLIESIVAPDLTVLEQHEPSVFNQAISQESAATITEMMVQAVNNGSGRNARIDGVDVAGKTGTAENGEGEPYTLWFTGFAPANDPEVVVAVVVEDGGGLGQSGFGGTVAAPIAKQVLEAVLSR